MLIRRDNDPLLRNRKHLASRGGATAHFGPRRFRAAAEQPTKAAPAHRLAELVELYLAHLADGALSNRGRPYSAKTVQAYRESLNRFAKAAAALRFPEDVAEIDRVHIDQFSSWLRKAGSAPASVSDWVRPLGPFFTWCIEREVLKHSPLDGHRRPKSESPPVKPFSQDELERLLAQCDERTWLGARDAAILWTLLDTGMRAQELVRLTLADLDRNNWTIAIEHGKGGKKRRARLGQSARRRVADFIVLFRGDEPGPLFPGRTGEALQRNGLTHLVRRLGKAADVTKAHPHRLRHTFALQYLRASGDLFTLQLLLGHSSLEMVRRYTAYLSMEDALSAHEQASPGDTLGLRDARRRRPAK